MNERPSPQHQESIALRTILDGPTEPFFEEVWQESCVLFKTDVERNDSVEFDAAAVKASPYTELLRHGWPSLVKLLETARRRFDDPSPDSFPLLFQNRENVSPVPYHESLFHAYLDGCSIVINHSDEICPYLASLCQDLQKSFPHAYANTYLTPPNSQAVKPHADDRDVLIMQIYGEKRWKVYKAIPVPYPYPHEQVGKEGLEVPPPVLEGDLLMDRVLKPGDVLYMPRGYVHEASTLPNMPSYHATIALATQDWTLAGLLTAATQHTLSRVISNRRALPVHLGRRPTTEEDLQALQSQMEAAWDELKTQVTAENLIDNLTHRYAQHNQRVLPIRQAVLEKAAEASTTAIMNTNVVVGPEAARMVQLSTAIRAATPDEKASVVETSSTEQPRGLNVREATADVILEILGKLKQGEGLTCRVADLKDLVGSVDPLVCELTLLSFAKTCVELGALAVVE